MTNANNGHIDWSYSIADSDLDFLAAGETLILTSEIVLSDGTLAAGKDLKDTTTVQITITGTNDAPTITAADTSGAVAEDGTQTALGTIAFKDVDLTNTHTVTDALTNGSVTSTLPGFDPAATRLGTLSLVVNEDNTDTDNIGTVGWTFTSDNDLAQQLAEGQAVTQVYTVTIKDTNDATATQDVTVTIAGTNDKPVVTSNAQAAEIVELANGHNSTEARTASGDVTFTDVDLIDSHAVTITGVSIDGTTAGLANYATVLDWLSLETFVNSTNGGPGSQAWSFSAEDFNFDYLAYGQSVTLTYTIEVDDHHTGGVVSQDVVITIEGNDEPPLPALDLNGDASGLNNIVGYSHDDNTPVLIAAGAQVAVRLPEPGVDDDHVDQCAG